MPESEDSGSGCCEGRQEQNSVFQSKHDGGFSAGLGKSIQPFNSDGQLTGYIAEW